MKNIPNILTVFRIFLVPVFAVLLMTEHYAASAVIVLLSAATDIADGFIARRFNLVSVTGQVLDPLADKLMQLAIVASLWAKALIPTWAILIMAGKELIMICGGSILYFFKKKTAIPAMWFGKAATCLFYFTVIFIMLFRESFLIKPLITITTGFMVFSLIMYLIRFLGLTVKSDKTASE